MAAMHFFAVFLRIGVFYLFSEKLAGIDAIVPPAFSALRLEEHFFRQENGFATIDVVSPLHAALLQPVAGLSLKWITFSLHLICDVVCAVLLRKLAVATGAPPKHVEYYVLLNPFSIVACISSPITAIDGAGFLLCCLFAASGSVTGFAALSFLVFCLRPKWIFVLMLLSRLLPRGAQSAGLVSLLGAASATLAFAGSGYLDYALYSFGLDRKWQVPLAHLTPSISCWWYPLSLVFDRFATFAAVFFNTPSIVFALPLVVRFPCVLGASFFSHVSRRTRPLFACSILLGVTAVFDFQPSFVDFGLVSALLLMDLEVWQHTRHAYVGFMMATVVVAAVLVILMRHAFFEWFVGNPNWVFAQNLLWTFSWSQVLIELVRAAIALDTTPPQGAADS